jgi:DNA-binding Xre family transcriptional regulator
VAKSFEELRKQIPPERRARSRRRAEEMLAELRLWEVRAACDLTQEELAERLHIDQPNVSRLENRSDVHVSTLADYITALGGRLELLAVFPEGTVRIAQFGNGGDA